MKLHVDDKMYLDIQAKRNAYLKVIAQEMISIRRLLEKYADK
jgi:hypothetical protein